MIFARRMSSRESSSFLHLFVQRLGASFGWLFICWSVCTPAAPKKDSCAETVIPATTNVPVAHHHQAIPVILADRPKWLRCGLQCKKNLYIEHRKPAAETAAVTERRLHQSWKSRPLFSSLPPSLSCISYVIPTGDVMLTCHWSTMSFFNSTIHCRSLFLHKTRRRWRRRQG